MTNYPYILFNQSPEQLRRIGARGGRAYGRNQRARRRADEQTAAPAVPSPAPSLEMETVAEAITILDPQFPWLCGAEKRLSRTPPRQLLSRPGAHARLQEAENSPHSLRSSLTEATRLRNVQPGSQPKGYGC
jgi:hypothetical protein